MGIVSKEELKNLFEKRNRFCVSIFLPTPRLGKDVEEGRIQLKDLLRDAEARLAAAGLAKSGVGELLVPARQLTQESEFWRYQSDGLALYLARDYFRCFRLPLKLPAFVVTADQFEITPLLPIWTSEDRFLLLALSRKKVRLFEGTRYAISELDVKGIPGSLQETLESSVDESQRQQHTVRPGLPEDELLYFRQIDMGLRESITDQRVPLVLAGVEDAVSLYRHVNTYAGLLDGCVTGNPDRLSAEDLGAKARKTVQTYYDQTRKQAIRRFTERSDAAKISKKLQEILPAASRGRIHYLFVALGGEKWGRFDPEENVVSVHESAEKGDQELLNFTVIQTILHGGSVYALEPSEMPDGSLIAALFRY
ncbi:MAG: hypothetical protein HYX73_10220 [Acidobacteria bacterium]|nr:hypothetical protein [Acidobacteriota bacterium]